MNKTLYNMLLDIDNEADLKDAGVLEIKVEYNQAFLRKVLSMVFKKYKDVQIFDLKNWIIFREGIIENLYNKGKCKVKFIR